MSNIEVDMENFAASFIHVAETMEFYKEKLIETMGIPASILLEPDVAKARKIKRQMRDLGFIDD